MIQRLKWQFLRGISPFTVPLGKGLSMYVGGGGGGGSGGGGAEPWMSSSILSIMQEAEALPSARGPPGATPVGHKDKKQKKEKKEKKKGEKKEKKEKKEKHSRQVRYSKRDSSSQVLQTIVRLRAVLALQGSAW